MSATSCKSEGGSLVSGVGSVSEGESWQVVLFFGREGKGEAGAAGPVPEERRQVKKGKMVTRVCSMSADVFLSHTAVCLMKRSSSRLPCGLELESPNLSVASSTWLHAAAPDFTS